MNQLCMTFTETRSHRNDGQTSREAAKAAVSRKAALERLAIAGAVCASPWGLTAREVALRTDLDYIEVQRRISECGLVKTDERRDGCAVWVAV